MRVWEFDSKEKTYMEVIYISELLSNVFFAM